MENDSVIILHSRTSCWTNLNLNLLHL